MKDFVYNETRRNIQRVLLVKLLLGQDATTERRNNKVTVKESQSQDLLAPSCLKNVLLREDRENELELIFPESGWYSSLNQSLNRNNSITITAQTKNMASLASVASVGQV